MVRARDVENCAVAVEIIRDTVMQYELGKNKEEKESNSELDDVDDITKDESIIDAIAEFDEENKEPSTEKSSVLDGLIAEAEKSFSTAEKPSAFNKNNEEMEV